MPLKELQFDADEIFTIVAYDPIVKSLDHQQAKDAIHEALEMLQSAPEPGPEEQPVYKILSPEVHCMPF